MLVAALVALCGSSAGVLLFVPVERGRATTDAGFVVVARVARIEAFVIRGPGSGSDQPGVLEVFAPDGRSCGAAPLPMLSSAQDLRWSLDDTPRTATLIGAAVWNLDTCTVDTSGW